MSSSTTTTTTALPLDEEVDGVGGELGNIFDE
jgi:hypothetical protein